MYLLDAGQQKDLSRELIKLARQGGLSFKDRRGRARLAQENQAATEKEQGSGSSSSSKKISKSQSAPTLRKTDATERGSRRGGGWVVGESAGEIANFREKLEAIVETKGDLNFCEMPFYRSALWEAASRNNEAIVKVLYAKGASISQEDHEKRTPLHEAAFYGHLNLIEFLLDRGHPVDCVDAYGQTPLFRAANNGRYEVAKRLLERGANPNLLDPEGVTVQHVAAFNGMPEFSRFMLYKGAFRNRVVSDDVVLRPKELGKSVNSLPGKAVSKRSQNRLSKSFSSAGSLVLGRLQS